MLITAPNSQPQGVPRWLKIFSIFIVVLLLVTVVVKLLTPNQVDPQPIITQNIDGSRSSFSNITFIGEEPVVPSSLPAGRASITKLSGNEIGKQLATNFNLTQNQNDPTIWDGLEYSMNSSNENSVFNLIGNASSSTETGNKISANVAIQEAQAILDQAVPQNTWQPLPNQVKYYASGGMELINSTPQSATLIEIPFSNTFGNYAIFSGQQLNLPAKVLLDSSYALVKLELRTDQITTAQQRKYNTISVQQALGQIEDGNAGVIDFLQLNSSLKSLKKINSAKFESVVIEYRVDPETGQAIPYYRFGGEITTGAGQTMTADVITPAIQTKFE